MTHYDTDDLDLGCAADAADGEQGLLYEHFRVEVDRGQAPVRVDKFLLE